MSALPNRLVEPMGKEAELQRKLPSGRIQCTACARLCQIGEGQIGLCGIRGVVNDKLYLLAYGKIIAGNIDPIEKKPVVHYRPGSKIFSVATTGCNWLCSYCFTPETAILTDQGIKTVETMFNESEHEKEIGYPRDVRVLSHTGSFKTVLKTFRHEYSGAILRIRPFYLPEISCTPNHEVFVYDEGTASLRKKRADGLSLDDLLAVPRAKDSIVSEMIDAYQTINMVLPTIRRKSRRTSIWTLREEKGRVKFGMSRGIGIPSRIAVDKKLAELFGTYCAEGCSIRAKSRPNSWVVVFSFGSHERELIERTENLLYEIFQIRAGRIKQGSEIRLEVYNNALGILFHALIGDDGYTKRVPELILHHQSTEILKSFLEAYLRGDGNSSASRGQAWIGTTSVSRELTLGTWYILFRLGYAPRFYVSVNPEEYQIEGRTVARHNDYMTRAMVAPNGLALIDRTLGVAASKLVQMNDYTLVPIRSIRQDEYSGYVYNMEVEGDHSYCASFVSVSNCQNADISQRRKVEGTDATPADVVRMAASYKCEGLAYTYNQPTIFIEYARDIGKLARDAGIFNIFVSNGYDTPESVGLMKEFLDCVTVDFKGSGETGFVRKYIGIPNAEPIFQTLLDIKTRTKIHTEITDLIVPGVGDNLEEARKLAKWVYDNLGPDTPIHFLRFHPDYKMKDIPSTPVLTLEKHYNAAKAEGLRYVYIGNVPGHPAESTYCPGCGKVLIKRFGYEIPEYNLDAKNKCRFCGYQTPIVGPLSKSVADDRFISVLY